VLHSRSDCCSSYSSPGPTLGTGRREVQDVAFLKSLLLFTFLAWENFKHCPEGATGCCIPGGTSVLRIFRVGEPWALTGEKYRVFHSWSDYCSSYFTPGRTLSTARRELQGDAFLAGFLLFVFPAWNNAEHRSQVESQTKCALIYERQHLLGYNTT
jgi:hypothetical protein